MNTIRIFSKYLDGASSKVKAINFRVESISLTSTLEVSQISFVGTDIGSSYLGIIMRIRSFSSGRVSVFLQPTHISKKVESIKVGALKRKFFIIKVFALTVFLCERKAFQIKMKKGIDFYLFL